MMPSKHAGMHERDPALHVVHPQLLRFAGGGQLGANIVDQRVVDRKLLAAHLSCSRSRSPVLGSAWPAAGATIR